MNISNNNNFAHCLYPVFTEDLVKRLKDRTSINLIGEVGMGRSRILEDIQKCDLGGVKVVLVNMKIYRKSYDGFIGALNQQMGFTGKAAPKDLAAWMNKITAKKQMVWVLLDYFDDLLDKVEIDARYRNQSFVDKVNSLRNHSYISLVCATTTSNESSFFYIDTEPITSPFLLEEQSMSNDLAYEKIKAELDRQLAGNEYWTKKQAQNNRGQYITFIRKYPTPFPFLMHVAQRIQLQSIDEQKMPVREKLSKWEKEYKKVKSPNLSKKIIKSKQGLRRFWSNATSNDTPQNQVNQKEEKTASKITWKVILAIVAAILGILNHFLGIFSKLFGG